MANAWIQAEVNATRRANILTLIVEDHVFVLVFFYTLVVLSELVAKRTRKSPFNEP